MLIFFKENSLTQTITGFTSDLLNGFASTVVSNISSHLTNLATSNNPSTPIANPSQSPTAPNAPQASPLDNLKDIHLPENIDQFPSAIGWWIVLSLIILALVFLIYKKLKKHHELRFLRSAKKELESLANEKVNGHSLTELSTLLKRICLLYFPAEKVASLAGERWWLFLNELANKDIYNSQDIKLLTQARYQKPTSLSLETPPVEASSVESSSQEILSQTKWLELTNKTEMIIERVIRTQLKAKVKQNKNKAKEIKQGVVQ